MDILAFREKVDDYLIEAGILDEEKRNRLVSKIAAQALKYADWFMDEVHQRAFK